MTTQTNKSKTNNTGFEDTTSSYPSVRSKPTAWEFEIDIDRIIDQPANWREEIDCIRAVGPNDTLYMRINSDGGRLDTAYAIINAMKQCQGTIITELVGTASSAGTAIFIHGDEFIINDYITGFMIHQPSHGFAGADNNVYDYAIYQRKQCTFYMEEVYKGFLTQEEIDKTLHGQELWLSREEILERCQKRIELNAEEAGIPNYTRESFDDMGREEILDFLFPPDDEEESSTLNEEVKEGLYSQDEIDGLNGDYIALMSCSRKELQREYNIKAKSKKELVAKIMTDLWDCWEDYIKEEV